MKTTQEPTRAPKASKPVNLLDQSKYRRVLVEDEIPGVDHNPHDVDWYMNQGYEVASTDRAVTGHKRLTLMVIPHEVYNEREAQRLAKGQAGYVDAGDTQAVAKGLTSGVMQREGRGYKLSEMGAALPSRSEIESREATAEFNAMTTDHPAVLQAAETVAKETAAETAANTH